jgi:hypothetical protein
MAQVEGSGTVVGMKLLKAEAATTLAPSGKVSVRVGGSPRFPMPPLLSPKTWIKANIVIWTPSVTLKLSGTDEGIGILVALLKKAVLSSVKLLGVPSWTLAIPFDRPVSVPFRLRVAVMVAWPPGNPVYVNESQIDDDAEAACEYAVRTPDARSAVEDSENGPASLSVKYELDAAAVVDPVPPSWAPTMEQPVPSVTA